jgi:hypothetical protein
MKNKLFIIISAAYLLLTCFACSDDFLREKRDYNNMVPVDIFKDPTQANAVFGTIYKQILGNYATPLCSADPLMRQAQSTGGIQYILTEEIPSGFAGSGIVGDARYNGDNAKTTKAGNHIANPPYWNDPRGNQNYNNFTRATLFPTVFLINDYIKEIDLSGRTLYNNKAFWDGLKGQAIFARAWLYFDAVRFWGGVPFYSTEKEAPIPGDRSLRMPVPDCIEKICADFEAAAELLPAKWDAENDGRFTSVAALAMLSRVRLYAASPVFNASWDKSDGQRWELALQASLAAEQAATAAGYGATVSDIESWDNAFYSYDGVFNAEAIIKVPKSNLTTAGTFNKWEGIIRPGAVANSVSAGLPAPEQMINLFPMKNGKRPTVANGYDDEKFYRNRDPRFYKTFAFSGCQWPGTNTQIWLYAYKYSNTEFRYTDGTENDAGAWNKSRAIVWKMSDPNVPVASETTARTDIIDYRFAEILLNIAECYAAKGDAGNCLAYLAKIRQRVGIDATDNYGLGNISGKYALIEAVLYERFVEFAYEGKRPGDMRRWLLYEGGAGYDPRLTAIDGNNIYDPESAYGIGWKLYNGKNGRPEYSKTDNILTKLGLHRFSGTKHTSKIWTYDLTTAYNVSGFANHPLKTNTALLAVTPIKRTMSETDRNAAFDKLEALYAAAGLQTAEPAVALGPKYGMDSGNNLKAQNFVFAWRGWYYVYPLHYDAYTPGKGNEWIEQTEGWMRANANPSGVSSDEQDGKYVYCTPE